MNQTCNLSIHCMLTYAFGRFNTINYPDDKILFCSLPCPTVTVAITLDVNELFGSFLTEFVDRDRPIREMVVRALCVVVEKGNCFEPECAIQAVTGVHINVELQAF